MRSKITYTCICPEVFGSSRHVLVTLLSNYIAQAINGTTDDVIDGKRPGSGGHDTNLNVTLY
jgi:hypothetical protein